VLKQISLWDGDTPVLVWSCYAVHPMSHYGKGQVSADFPAWPAPGVRPRLPRSPALLHRLRGDPPAGKYNTGAVTIGPCWLSASIAPWWKAWQNTQRRPLERVDFRIAELRLPARSTGDFTLEAMQSTSQTPRHPLAPHRSRASGPELAPSALTVVSPSSVPCLDWTAGGRPLHQSCPPNASSATNSPRRSYGPDPSSWCPAFGDGAPGYVPTDQCWRDGYQDEYCWVHP